MNEEQQANDVRDQASNDDALYEAHKLILKNYNFWNQTLANQLSMASDHSSTTGQAREKLWMELLRSMIPLKYSLAQGVKIIDSKGGVSKEVDIAVFDEQYTPYVFQYGGIKYIPIEAVVVVVECKSRTYDHPSLIKWSESIRKLSPSSEGIARMTTHHAIGLTSPTQTQTRPIQILAMLGSLIKDGFDREGEINLKDYFDFIILENIKNDKETFEIILTGMEKSLAWWSKSLNKGEKVDDEKDLILTPCNYIADREVGDAVKIDRANNKITISYTLAHLVVKENPLLTLNLQLNQLLMLVNNPMLFPHFAYARAFNNVINQVKAQGGSE